MKKIIALVLSLAMVLSLAACGGSSSISVTVKNDSSMWGFDGIYISSADNQNWGQNLVEAGIEAGSETTVSLPQAGTYDLRAQDDDGDYWEFYGLELEDGAEIVIPSWNGLTVNGTEVSGKLTFASTPTETPVPGGSNAPLTPTDTPDAGAAWSRDITVTADLSDTPDQTVWYVLMSPSTSTSWGADLLGPNGSLHDPDDGVSDITVTVTSEDGTAIFDLGYELETDWYGVQGIDMDGVESIIISGSSTVSTVDGSGNILETYNCQTIEDPRN